MSGAMNPYLKETAIGVAAACVSLIIVVALMEGGRPGDFGSAVLLLLFNFISPILVAPTFPWLLIVYALACGLVFLQFKRMPWFFMRYVVGAEIVMWQFLGMWCTARIVAA